MPPRGEAPDVVRIVEGLRGSVDMRMELALRFDYGSIVPWVRSIDGQLVGIAGPDAVALRTPVELEGRDLRTYAEFTVREGERVPFVLTWYPSHRATPDHVEADEALADALDYWNEWAGRFAMEGRWRDDVLRSLLTLKALTFAPTGGIVAAPTTSLPEALGGVRNWDYRYCWLRDATLTLLAFLRAGYLEEARAWREWLLRAIAGSADRHPGHVRRRAVSVASPSSSSRGSRGTRARARFASATAPPTSGSWTCTGRSSTRSTWPA